MKEESGDSYVSSKHAKALFASDAKVGKTSFLVASCLGVLPWQRSGGVVDAPTNLHVITFDANAAGGLKRFLLETCSAPKEALQFRIYNMQQDLLDAAGTGEYDYTFLNTVKTTIETIRERSRGTSAVIVSSLTGMSEGLLSSVRLPAGEKKGGGMDMAKWGDFALQVSELRSLIQSGSWHTLWEAHVLRMMRKGQTQADTTVTESIQVPGQSGVNFPYNVEQVFRIRRMFGQPVPGTKCDQVYLDTRPAYEFVANGRGFTEALEPKEFDLALAFSKLGLVVGGWNSKTKVAVPKQQTTRQV